MEAVPGPSGIPATMYIFRQGHEPVSLADLLAALESATTLLQPSRPLRVLLAMSRLECALADAWSPEQDDLSPGRERLCAILGAVARDYISALAGVESIPAWPALHAALAPWLGDRKRLLVAPKPEGFRFHAVVPASYAEAARGWRRVGSVWVLGLRGIGSALGAAVAAALSEPGRSPIRFTTVRPRGDPGERHLRLSARLRSALAGWPGHFAIVDEGPGLSGSSLAGSARALEELGVGAPRIALFTSWRTDGRGLSSGYAARNWRRWQQFAATPAAPPVSPACDCSAGQWRRVLGVHRNAPVWPQHERLKYLSGGLLWKFSGLGDWGVRVRERAVESAAAGFGPPVASGSACAAAGWLAMRRLPAKPLPRHWSAVEGRAFAIFAGRYLAWRGSSTFHLAPRSPPTPEMLAMATINRQRLGLPVDPGEAPFGPRLSLDGRMLRPEWGRTPAGFVKFDGVDHADDHFFPGPADIAWDLAAFTVEFGPELGAAMLAEYIRRSGDQRELGHRVTWHRRAYCLFRAAYCSFAATQVPQPDAARFSRAAAAYRRALVNGLWRPLLDRD